MAKPRKAATDRVELKRLSVTSVIAGDGSALSEELLAMRQTLFPPASQKTLRSFSSSEAAAKN